MPDKKVNVEEETNSIMHVLAAYKAAIYEKNVNAFIELYDSDARVFDTWNVWLFESVSERLSVISAWLGGLGSERVTVNFENVLVTYSHDLAMVNAVGTYAAISVEGVELRSMQNRFTWALRFSEKGWKIIHEHTSVPIADDLTAKLTRDL
jgi:ketosteroid isomerase-like protein